MPEAKHTPGPWGFGRTSDDQRIVLGDDGKGRYVCNVQIHQTPRAAGLFSEAEREANARLILAAPDLLDAALATEASDLAHSNCDECGGEGEAELCGACFPAADDARLKRRAALAKAGL